VKNGYIAVLIHLLDRGHRGVKTDPVVQPQNVFFGNTHRRAIVAIKGVGMRHHRIQVVVAAGKLENNYYRFFFLGGDFDSPLAVLAPDLITAGCCKYVYANWYSLSDTIN
jgi:hypothetical protein